MNDSQDFVIAELKPAGGGEPIRVRGPREHGDKMQVLPFGDDADQLDERLRGAGTLLIPRSQAAVGQISTPGDGTTPAIEIVEDDDPRLSRK